MTSPPLRLRILGSPRLEDSRGQDVGLALGKPFALFIYLALERRPVGRDELARILWPDSDRSKARTSVRHALWALRSNLGNDLFREEDPVGIPDGFVQTDASLLEHALAEGRFTEAVALWSGRPFDGFGIAGSPMYERWLEEWRERLIRRFVRALQDGAVAHRQEGDLRTALTLVDAALDAEPFLLKLHRKRLELLLDLREFSRATEALVEARASAEDSMAFDDLEGRMKELRHGLDGGEDRKALKTELVGRAGEFAQLVAMWRQAQNGRPGVAIVRGMPGVGKTRLADEIETLVKLDSGAPSVRIKAYRTDQPLAWGLVSELAASLLRLSGAAGISHASETLLLSLVPSHPSPHAGSVPVSITEAGVADALLDLISAVAYEGCFLIVLDDVQWFDAESRRVLASALRRLDRMRCAVIVTSRGPRGGPDLDAADRGSMNLPGALKVDLEPLAQGDLEELLSLQLEDPETTDVQRAASQLHIATGGVPLLVVEFLRILRQEGILDLSTGHWRVDWSRWKAEKLPSSFRSILTRRIEALSPSSRALAREIAIRGGEADPDRLAAKLPLSPVSFTSALDELVHSEVVNWTASGRVTLAHDELMWAIQQVESTVDAPAGHPIRSSKGRWIGAAALVAAIVAFSVFPMHREPPFGGGAIHLWQDTGEFRLLPQTGGARPWPLEEVRRYRTPDVMMKAIERTTDGAIRRFANTSGPQVNPDIVELHGEREAQVIVSTSGDDGFLALSPTGLEMLHWSQRQSAPTYAHDLYISSLDGNDGRLLYRAAEKLSGIGAWAPDGRLIAYRISAPQDTLAVAAPDGSRVRSIPFDRVNEMDWCAGSRELVALVDEIGRGPSLVHVDVTSEGIERIDVTGTPVSHITCSPDGSAVAYQTAFGQELRTVVQDLQSAEVIFPVPPGSEGPSFISWVPDSLPQVPTSIFAHQDTIGVRWGERRQLQGAATYSDGSVREGGLTWHSTTPAVASVTEGGLLTGNRPGRGSIVAAMDGWLQDTVIVDVLGEPSDELVFSDRFVRLDTAIWAYVGHPAAQPVVEDGFTVLHLNGDGLYTDGILSRRSWRLPQGGTLELDFRLPISRPDKQAIQLCLMEAAKEVPVIVSHTEVPHEPRACFVYPSDELLKFHPSRALVYGNNTLLRVEAPEHLPPTEWTHLAVELWAGGEVVFYLNREPIGRVQVRAFNPDIARWSFGVFGSSVDTQAMIRDLRLWGEPRYSVAPEEARR